MRDDVDECDEQNESAVGVAEAFAHLRWHFTAQQRLRTLLSELQQELEAFVAAHEEGLTAAQSTLRRLLEDRDADPLWFHLLPEPVQREAWLVEEDSTRRTDALMDHDGLTRAKDNFLWLGSRRAALRAIQLGTVSALVSESENCLRRLVEAILLKTMASEDVVATLKKNTYGLLPNWRKWLVAQFGIELSDEDLERSVDEVFHRRNCWIHNGGYADAKYLEKTGPVGIVEEDYFLNLDGAYIRQAQDAFEMYFIGLASRLWARAEPTGAQVRIALLGKVCYEALCHSRWPVAESHAARILEDKATDRAAHEIASLNRWLAIKRMGNFSGCREAVLQWEPLDHTAQCGRLALLDEWDACLERLRSLIGKDDRLTPSALQELPVFEEVRNDYCFTSIVSDAARLVD